MVLLEPPAKPARWKFLEKNGKRQTTLLQYSGVKSSRPAVDSQRNDKKILPDCERAWVPPEQLSLCRKGFLLRTDLPANRELVRRLIRDLTYDYPETRFEKQRREQRERQFWYKSSSRPGTSSKPPLHCFCSFSPNEEEKLLLQPQHTEHGANQPQLSNNDISENADWTKCLTDNSQRAAKKRRALSANYLLVPKFFLLEQLKKRSGVTFQDDNLNGAPMAETLRFTDQRQLVETTRRPQVSATTFALKHLRKTGGAVLVLPVGCGKTVCALYIAMQLRVCTLVVLGNESLIDQWCERIEEYCPGARIGRIQGPQCITDDCDFVIASTKSLSERPYSARKLRNIGLTIFDEAVHAGAPTYLTAVWQGAAPFMLALSADPTRSDGMTHILYNFFSYNVFVVQPTLPPGIELHIGVHRFSRRCFVQDADCVSANRLRDRRHNANKESDKLEYCEALASFDKRHYAKACISSASLVGDVTDEQSDREYLPLPGVAKLHALSEWQSEFAGADVTHLNYTQVYQTLQCDAHRNAVIVAYVKQFLRVNNANRIAAPTVEECNNLTPNGVPDPQRGHVLVQVAATDSTKTISECTRQEVQSMVQVERQILILCSEKQHIDALHDRLIRSGIGEHMIGVFVGGTKYSKEQRVEILSRRIVIATYSLAAEGLDLATLNTIIFATPRSSIVDQALGRALRDKLNSAIMPYILDLCDYWCNMTKRMYYTRNRSYKHYGATYHIFDDFASFDAVGAVCWKKPRRNRTQRVLNQKKLDRERIKAEKLAAQQKQKAQRASKDKRKSVAGAKRSANEM